jgi:hypothetical protein
MPFSILPLPVAPPEIAALPLPCNCATTSRTASCCAATSCAAARYQWSRYQLRRFTNCTYAQITSLMINTVCDSRRRVRVPISIVFSTGQVFARKNLLDLLAEDRHWDRSARFDRYNWYSGTVAKILVRSSTSICVENFNFDLQFCKRVFKPPNTKTYPIPIILQRMVRMEIFLPYWLIWLENFWRGAQAVLLT